MNAFSRDSGRELLFQLRALGLPEPVLEYRFAFDAGGVLVRKWRFDLAYVDRKLAIEIDGGLLTGGRHGGTPSAVRDIEKRLAAAALGWRVLHFRPGQVRSGEALVWVQAALGLREVPLRQEDRDWRGVIAKRSRSGRAPVSG